jgi:cbb3-type cytochrome oxidase maturation protein
MTKITPRRDCCHPSKKGHRDTLRSISQRLHLMKAIFFLIVLSLIVAIGFLIAFFWAVRSGQYDDDYTPSVRMLFDDTKEEVNEKP